MLTGKSYVMQIVYVSETMPFRFRHTGVYLSTVILSLFCWLLVFAAPIFYPRRRSHGWRTSIVDGDY